MPAADHSQREHHFLPRSELDKLIRTLRADGYTVIGPRLVNHVIHLRPVESAEDLARGARDEQQPGHYRVAEGDTDAYFDHVVGPDSPKRYLFPPVQQVFSLKVNGEEFEVEEGPPSPPKLAFLGIRPCEVAGILVQDKVFVLGDDTGKAFRCELDAYYEQARENSLIIAVNCTRPGGTCFCASMGTGPRASEGFDLAMTEQKAGFVVEVGTAKGAALMKKLPVRETTTAELELADLQLERARQNMGRELETDGLADILDRNVDHPRWDEVAKRCLGCGNCALTCPTCFCSSMIDSSDLQGKHVARTRVWDVCYTHQFSYTTGGAVRSTIPARYRHWLRHKLGTWHAQFGTSGCVGCGRCITWCPVGIDITEEATVIRASEPAGAPSFQSARGAQPW